VLEALLTGEHTILERRRVPSPGGDGLDVLTRSFAGEPHLSRWWTVKDGGSRGGRLHLLEARARERLPAARRFALDDARELPPAHPTPWDYVERLTSFARKSPNDILCFYPESWQLEVKSEGPLVAHLWQVLGGRLPGRISLVSLAGGRDAALEAFAGTLEGSLGWVRAQVCEPFGRLERAWTRRGRAAPNETAVELDVHIGERGEGAVALGVAALGEVDPLGRAILRRALEVVRETFRIA